MGASKSRVSKTASHQPDVMSEVTSAEFQLLPSLSETTLKFDSLNHERIINQYFLDEQKHAYKHRRVFGYTGRTAMRWVLTLLAGVVTALVAKLLMYIIGVLSEARTHELNKMQTHHVGEHYTSFEAYILFVSWNLLMAAGSCLAVLFISPQAAGSGIAEVKAYLNGTHIPYFLSSSAFLVKLFGTVLSVSSGLLVGPEGPLVHLGAIVGSSLTRGVKNFRIGKWKKRVLVKGLMPFRNDSDRRDFISIGVAAGFAAAFGAPIGGVLFSLEEASTYWSGKLMWRALAAATLACLVLNALTRSDLSYFGLISLQTNQEYASNYNSFAQLPAFAVLGIFGGLGGALYNKVAYFMAIKRGKSKLLKFLEVLLVSILTSTAIYLATILLGVCSDSRTDWMSGSKFELQFNCEDGKYNELASLMLGVKEDVIKEIIYDPLHFRAASLVTCFLLFYPLQILAFGIAIPAGIFMPTILVGCCFGGFVGNVVANQWGEVNPGAFALIGAVALLGGIQRTTISLCVIMMEGTGQTQLLLPIILTTVIANYVGNMFGEGVYEQALHLKHIPFLDHKVHHELHLFQARHAMNTNVQVLHARETVQNIIEKLSTTPHAGFPVVRTNAAGGPEKLIGFVLRNQLYTLLEEMDFGGGEPHRRSEFLWDIQVPNLHVRHQYETTLHGRLKGMEKDLIIDLERAMNIGPLTVTPDCPLSRTHTLFCSMALRHLVVVDSEHVVVGIITRKDLLRVQKVISKHTSVEEKERLMEILRSPSLDPATPRNLD